MDTVSMVQRKHPRKASIIFLKIVKRGHDDTLMQEFLERYETDGYRYQSLQFNRDGAIPYSFIFAKERTDQQIDDDQRAGQTGADAG